MKYLFLMLVSLVFTTELYAQVVAVELKYKNQSIETKTNAKGEIETTVKDFGYTTDELLAKEAILRKLVDRKISVNWNDIKGVTHIVRILPRAFIADTLRLQIVVEVEDQKGNIFHSNDIILERIYSDSINKCVDFIIEIIKK
jgi:hypothetical protein